MGHGRGKESTTIDLVAITADLATGTPAGSIAKALVGGVWDLARRFEDARVKRAVDQLVEDLLPDGIQARPARYAGRGAPWVARQRACGEPFYVATVRSASRRSRSSCCRIRSCCFR